jgi:hypothetical protein
MRLLGVAPQGLRHQHRLAGGGRCGHRLDVKEVRHADHHHVGVGMPDGLLDAGGVLRDAPSLAERGPTLLRARIDHPHSIAPALAVQGGRIEVADEAGAQHGDLVGAHGSGVLRSLVGNGWRWVGPPILVTSPIVAPAPRRVDDASTSSVGVPARMRSVVIVTTASGST